MKTQKTFVVIVAVVLIACGRAESQCLEWVKRATTFQPEGDPSHGSWPAIAYNAVQGTTTLYGSSDSISTHVNETWLWSGAAWTQCVVGAQPSSSVPSGRVGHAMAYDSRRQVAVLYGGYDDTGIRNDTWEWNGLNWALRAIGGPPPLQQHEMVYDAARGATIVLMCGAPSPNFIHWEWDGDTWTQRIPPSQPPQRYNFGLAYDSARHVTVMFGGEWDGGRLNDTWEFDGNTWIERTVPMPPPARRFPAIAFDAARGVTVMFGGEVNGVTWLNDTWEWDGQSWIDRTSTLKPAAKYNSVMAFDSRRGKAVLFGYTNQGNYEVWEYPATPGPYILVQPVTPTVCLGGSVTFIVEAGGTTPLEYQWRKNGYPMDGKTDPFLTFNNVDFGHIGNYDVVVTNICGSATSNAATMDLCAGPAGCPSPVDVNGDGVVDGRDIQRMIEVLLGL